MSGALAHARALFVETPARPAATAAPLVARPTVAVVCAPARAQVAVAAVALALAGACGAPFSLVAGVGVGTVAPASLAPAARRAAARLRQQGERADAVGRVVWLAAAPQPAGGGEADDAAGAAAGASVALARAARSLAAPAALAVPLSRTAAVDRVLAWHDAIVVVREPGTSRSLGELVLGSLEELQRPVVAMEPPARTAARAARAGLRAPACAVEALTRLHGAAGTLGTGATS